MYRQSHDSKFLTLLKRRRATRQRFRIEGKESDLKMYSSASSLRLIFLEIRRSIRARVKPVVARAQRTYSLKVSRSSSAIW